MDRIRHIESPETLYLESIDMCNYGTAFKNPLDALMDFRAYLPLDDLN